MKAKSIRYLPKGGLEIVEIDVPSPGPGEVQVRGSACGICAWDLNTFRNGTDAGRAAPPGHEGIGYVTALGAGVSGIKVGDRVAAGGFFTLQNVPAGRAYVLPESDLADEYWCVEPVSCIVTGIDLCHLRIGDRVAVVGCGFMGLLLLQGLVRSYAERVLAFDVVPDRLQLAQGFGAHAVYNPTDGDFEAMVPEIASLGIDTVVDASGSQAAFALSNRLVRRGGMINNFGWIHGPMTVVGDDWHGGGYTIVNSSPSAKIRDTFPVAIRLIHSGMVELERLVTHVVPLEEMPVLLDSVVKDELPGYIKGVVKLD